MISGPHLARAREVLRAAVGRNTAEGILLSAGLDTSLVAALACPPGRPLAITVCTNERVPDHAFAVELAGRLGLEHEIVWATLDQLLAAMPAVVRILRCYDPMELRNAVAVYLGLRRAAERGLQSVATGDGADELFAGYSYMFGMPEAELERYLGHLAEVMHFTSGDLGRALGLEIRMPYLDPTVVEFALALPSAWKIRERGGQKVGKWLLREAFEGLLPERFLWRTKVPIEFGSGSAALVQAVESRVSETEFTAQVEVFRGLDGVQLRSREHLYYYRVYREAVGPPVRASEGRACPDCGSALPRATSRYCTVCGAYPL